MTLEAYEAFAEADIARDEATADTVLVGIDRLGETVVGPDGRRAAAFDPGARAAVTADTGGGDWSDFDQLVIPVWIDSATGTVLNVTLSTGTRTPGLHVADTFHTWTPLGTSARFPHNGWQDALLPFESFHIVGMPDGWRRIDAITIGLGDRGGRVLVGDVRGQRRRRPAGPRLTPDALFDELDLTKPELAQVADALKAADRDRAGQELLKHFSRRTEPRHVFPRHFDSPAAANTDQADRLLEHVILDQALPAEIDWRANPNGYLEWRHAFNRHAWMRPLLAAYLDTGDERYAAELDVLLRTWIEQSPCPVGHTGGGDPAWETLSTAVRIYGIWLDVWCGLKDSPAFRDATRLMMLRSIWAHAEHLMEHSVTWHNNWEIVESEAVALIGLMFPEFRRAATWCEEGLDRLWRELDRQVHEDGLQWELAPGYHMMSGQGFVLPYRLARLNDIAVPPQAEGRLRQMFDAIMHLTRPDGTLPSLNDSGDVAGSGAAWLKTGSDLFDRRDWLWVATGGKEGERPTAGSWAFDHAGLYVMRSGWHVDDRWLVFDGAPLGRSHQHEDELSFEAYAFGTRFIVDPGISSYMREPWTDYFRSARAHNTIAIDGCPQARRGGAKENDCRSVAGENLWAAGDVIDVAGSTCEGPYGDVTSEVVHRRWIVFVKPDYWLVFDEVAGQGSHMVESLLHFAPMRLRVGTRQELVCTDRLGHPNLDVLAWPQAGRWRVRLETGQNDPVQGWIAGAQREILPAPAAVISRRAPLPVRSVMVLVPYQRGTCSGVRIQRRPAPRGCWYATLHLPDGRSDHVEVAWEAAPELRGRGLRTDGRFAVVRCESGGAVASAAVVEGRRLSFLRRRLIAEDEPATLIQWRG